MIGPFRDWNSLEMVENGGNYSNLIHRRFKKQRSEWKAIGFAAEQRPSAVEFGTAVCELPRE